MLRRKNDFVKKRAEVHFPIFIENRNWDLKFVFRFDNENEKRKKIKINPCTESAIQFSF